MKISFFSDFFSLLIQQTFNPKILSRPFPKTVVNKYECILISYLGSPKLVFLSKNVIFYVLEATRGLYLVLTRESLKNALHYGKC